MKKRRFYIFNIKTQVVLHVTTCTDVYSEDFVIINSNIKSQINRLHNNKSSGIDNISAKHFKFAGDNISRCLTICFTTCFIHGIFRKSLLDVVLIPVVKHNCGKINGSNNYRPIALATVASKLLERTIL